MGHHNRRSGTTDRAKNPDRYCVFAAVIAGATHRRLKLDDPSGVSASFVNPRGVPPMNELLTDEKLTTADIANPPTRPGDVPNSGISESHASMRSESMPSASMPSDGEVVARNSQPIADDSQSAQHNALFAKDELESLRSSWTKVQSSFVDEPRAAVEQADNLVANVVKRIAEQFASEREQLEKQWDQGDKADTENLRQAIKRYRAFFDRLLAF
jgi:hypothetical protein